MNATPVSYKPGVFYFRKALRESDSCERAVEVGLVVCAELERTRNWIREQGLPVPKWIVDPQEAAAKGWRHTPDDLRDCG
jgi:hypothetical protein